MQSIINDDITIANFGLNVIFYVEEGVPENSYGPQMVASENSKDLQLVLVGYFITGLIILLDLITRAFKKKLLLESRK